MEMLGSERAVFTLAISAAHSTTFWGSVFFFSKIVPMVYYLRIVTVVCNTVHRMYCTVSWAHELTTLRVQFYYAILIVGTCHV